MENSPFSRLSAELRNRIYLETFSGSEGITIYCEGEELDKEDQETISKKLRYKSTNISLTETCQRIREESLKMYYYLNPITILAPAPLTKVFPNSDTVSHLTTYRSLIGDDLFREIRHINIKLQTITLIDLPRNAILDMTTYWFRKVRGFFRESVRAEVHFELRLGRVKNWRDMVWNMDESIERLEERLPGADRTTAVTWDHATDPPGPIVVFRALLRGRGCYISPGA